ncbi:hypothetical protein GOBAR_AA17518 [Gossypium barbadense]|uniref:Uncharacterized protein n=1 Tax=Gossypium barbadense TaxID=3634 RepID=A0A2P5XIL7_GOSBA|nr:hypothetical protein GOBAR_AA17518 [Gossypium barbadense]
MMNELLELELWKIIGQGNDKSGGGYSGGGWAGLGRCGEPFPMELQVPKIAYGHVALPWQLIGSRVGETFLLYFHTVVSPLVVWARPKARACALPCGLENLCFSDSVSD